MSLLPKYYDNTKLFLSLIKVYVNRLGNFYFISDSDHI
jgi:hypothetical protein